MMDKISEKLAMSPNLLTYGMIGITTFILAALTLVESNEQEKDEEDSYVSQLFNTEESKEEAGLLSSILPNNSIMGGTVGQTNVGGKQKTTRRHKKKHAHTKTRAKRM